MTNSKGADNRHESLYKWDWLRARVRVSNTQISQQSAWLHFLLHKHKTNSDRLSFWNANIIRDPPIVEYEAVMKSDAGVKHWTALIVSLMEIENRMVLTCGKRKWGFCYVNGCPVTGEATQKLLERIAFIRNTHYGQFNIFVSWCS